MPYPISPMQGNCAVVGARLVACSMPMPTRSPRPSSCGRCSASRCRACWPRRLPALDERARDFIAASPFLVMATTGADGSCDAGPKGGPAGFVRVLTDTRLLVPEFPGNRRFDGVQNLVTRPGIGLLFVVPGISETLRVNGFARLTRDPELLDGLRGRRAAALVRRGRRGAAGLQPLRQGVRTRPAVAARDLARRRRRPQPEPDDRRRAPRTRGAANRTCGARSRRRMSPACSTASPPRTARGPPPRRARHATT